MFQGVTGNKTTKTPSSVITVSSLERVLDDISVTGIPGNRVGKNGTASPALMHSLEGVGAFSHL